MAIKCYHCKGNHELVVQVKDCAKVPALFASKVETGKIVETVIPALVKKVTVPAHRTSAAYLALKAQVAPAAPAPVVVVHESLSAIQATAKKSIDQQIDEHDAALAVIKKGQDLELGMYQVGDIIYKIKWNKTNTYKYAERLWISTTAKYDDVKGAWIDMPKGKFVYANSMMKTITSEHKMTEEMAKAFHDATKAKYGVDYGFCCVCGKLLTVKKSIDAGIGPVCVTKF